MLNNCFKFIVLLIISLMFSSCVEQELKEDTLKRGGVVLTFDDDYIDSWYKADSILNPEQWKATFCIYKPHHWTNQQLNKLSGLKKNGHEISGHGFESRNAIYTTEKNGLSWYLENDVIPLIDKMNEYSIELKTFAYPQGVSNSQIDSAMFNYFSILRKTSYGDSIPEKHNCYFTGDSVVYALGIDNHYEHFNPSYIMALLEFAKRNDQILLLYSHNPVYNAENKYETDMEFLQEICHFVNSNNMNFYTLNDLVSLE